MSIASETLVEYYIRVIGGGPAESTAATLLARKGFDVALPEKESHPRFHIEGSLLPCNLPLLRDLGILERSARIWAQTELLRLLHTGEQTPENAAKATLFAASFLKQFAPLSLKGGWIDHIDGDGDRLVEYMPASSLYHIYGAGRQIAL